MADKKGRVNAIIKKDLSNIIIYEMKNKLTDFASITEVKVTTDYSYATVYVSHVDPTKIDELAAYLENRKGAIRSMLAKQISIYKTPELRFVADHMYDQGHEMDVMIDEAVNRKPRTLKDVYGKGYKTPEEKQAIKEKKNMKKPSNKAAAKKAAAAKAAEVKAEKAAKAAPAAEKPAAKKTAAKKAAK